jgi:hypothetical protein
MDLTSRATEITGHAEKSEVIMVLLSVLCDLRGVIY